MLTQNQSGTNCTWNVQSGAIITSIYLCIFIESKDDYRSVPFFLVPMEERIKTCKKKNI